MYSSFKDKDKDKITCGKPGISHHKHKQQKNVFIDGRGLRLTSSYWFDSQHGHQKDCSPIIMQVVIGALINLKHLVRAVRAVSVNIPG